MTKGDPEELKKTAQANPHESMRAHESDFGISHQTVQRANKKVGEKIRVKVVRQLLTPELKETNLLRCKTLLNESFELFFDTFGSPKPSFKQISCV
uniref:Histonelysine Nmethyltransferase SETMARlike [Bombyx mori] n=1 Tax=Lepeophtheirus salmonis TaxID=72036 RepID=A0A0K2TCW2_LEPSM